MRILIAIDQNSYNEHTLAQVSNLAANTWADITLLGVLPKKDKDLLETEFIDSINEYQNYFLEKFDELSSPYLQVKGDKLFTEVRPNIYEQKYTEKTGCKELNVRVGVGNPVKMILEEAGEDGSDLIILGGETDNSKWGGVSNVPYKVALEAECSVLVVKEDNNTKHILCCLDNEFISHESLEMVGQMATLYNADLDLASISDKNTVKENVQRKLDELVRYYISQKIRPWIELVDISLFQKFISQRKKWSLITMWMGKKSILEKILPGNKVLKLIKNSDTSVLLLR